MSEIVWALPKEVLNFVAQCRKESYALGAQPNYLTDNSFEHGFRFEKNGLVYQDVSLERGGCFAGTEFVADSDMGLYYVIQYNGAKLPSWTDGAAIDEAQHGLIVDHPTLVRFGSRSVSLERKIGSRRFTYIETSDVTLSGRLNREVLWCTLPQSRTKTEVVYRGHSIFTIFRKNP